MGRFFFFFFCGVGGGGLIFGEVYLISEFYSSLHQRIPHSGRSTVTRSTRSAPQERPQKNISPSQTVRVAYKNQFWWPQIRFVFARAMVLLIFSVE